MKKFDTFNDYLNRREEEKKNYKLFRAELNKVLLTLCDKFGILCLSADLSFDERWKNYVIDISGEIASVSELDLKSVLRISRKDNEEKN